jgi:type I restriction enzyme R subunit
MNKSALSESDISDKFMPPDQPQAVRPELVEGLPPNPLGPLAPGGEEPKKYVVGAMVTVAVARERVQYLNAQGQLITESLRDYNPSPTLAALLKSSKALAVAPNT